MAPFGVVLDANALVPFTLRDTLLRCAEAHLYRLHWSEDILAEVRRNLLDVGVPSEEKADRLIANLRAAFPSAMVSGYDPLVQVMTNAPEDRHVVAAAIVANAQTIVTSNVRDFPEEALRQYGIEAQTPDEFLCDLHDLAPVAIAAIIREQVANLKNPPRSFDQVLDVLEGVAPAFVARLRGKAESPVSRPRAGRTRVRTFRETETRRC